MAIKSYIQGKINTNLADNSDILPIEHREVEDLLLNEHFPDYVKVEWNGSSAVDPITDIICNPALTTTAKCVFKVYFWKKGNTVEVVGTFRSTESATTISQLTFIQFPSSLYKPLTTSEVILALHKKSAITPTSLDNAKIITTASGLFLAGSMAVGTTDYVFQGFYKVAN